MNRAEIWIQFALGTAGQFPTAQQAAAAADDLLREFEERFTQASDRETWHPTYEHPAWKRCSVRP